MLGTMPNVPKKLPRVWLCHLSLDRACRRRMVQRVPSFLLRSTNIHTGFDTQQFYLLHSFPSKNGGGTNGHTNYSYPLLQNELWRGRLVLVHTHQKIEWFFESNYAIPTKSTDQFLVVQKLVFPLQ